MKRTRWCAVVRTTHGSSFLAGARRDEGQYHRFEKRAKEMLVGYPRHNGGEGELEITTWAWLEQHEPGLLPWYQRIVKEERRRVER